MRFLSWVLRLSGRGAIEQDNNMITGDYEPWVLLVMRRFEHEIETAKEGNPQSRVQMHPVARTLYLSRL
jgi:hypothetical protein|uniref:Uncharacterized protein n=1 Tax=Rhizobium rhizogenes TaxID=359 RepID=A0A7S4ZTT0_RHIRH|nr:hypothetical protein pC5.7b_359 [Rhizobium rhizogenes]